MSLAEELLADLDDEPELEPIGEENEDDIEEIGETEATGGYDRVGHVARLRNSDKFSRVMKALEEHKGLSHVESSLVVEANNLAADIDNEVGVIHKFVRDKYSRRFPELESLVPQPLEYVSSVLELGNDIIAKAKNNENLSRILLPATVIVVSVTAATTQGQPLSEDELAAVNEACQLALELSAAKMKIFEFVETRMSSIAPNLSAVVGSATAAKLLGVSGGLTQLSRIPACNLMLLGAQKKTLAGFSSAAILPHTGFVFYTSLVQSLPPDLRAKAARIVAAKCTLAARVDSVQSSPDGSSGRKLLEEVKTKMEKMLEPPPVKQIKALPKPLDMASKKRGGRRVRKMKERMGLTEMRKKANRMTFGALEEDIMQDNIGFSLGMAKSSGGGRIRAPQVDEKTRARLSKTLQKNLQRQQAYGGATSVRSRQSGTSGIASSVTFTPIQGLEIVNPNATGADQRQHTDTKYFAATASFMKIQTPKPE